MSRNFNLGEYLQGGGPTVDTREQIEYISLDRIDPDPENFYSLEGLDELAGNIELVGLQQPLRVRDGEHGRVIVVSGHRRRAACMLIRDGGSDMFKAGVPCIRETGSATKEMQELKLIFANSQTRVLSGAEISRQAERVTELLYKLQEQGVVFPGRMRDHVAEAVNTSKSRIGRLHAIRERLDKPLLKLFDKGKINETVSYALSQQPAETQRRICDAWTVPGRKLENMGAAFVTEWAESAERLSKLKCKLNKGGLCINQERIMDKICDASYDYKPCRYGTKCCAECHEYLRCRDRCPLLDEKAKAERAKQKEARKDELAAEKAQKEVAVRTVEQSWARYAQALSRAGTTDRHLRAQLGGTYKKTYNPFNMYMPDSEIEALLDYSATDTKPSTALPFFYSFHADDAEKLCRFADALDVSLDYLFLRSERPERAEEIIGDGRATARVAPTDDKPTWCEGEPPRDGRYLCRFSFGKDGDEQEATMEYKKGPDGSPLSPWIFFGSPLASFAHVVSWWPLPEK